MSIEENKAVILRFWEQFNKGNLKVMDECFSDKFVRYCIDGTVMNREDYKQFCTKVLTTIPNIQVTIGDVIAEGDMVAFYFTMSGTYKSESIDNTPKGKRFRMSEAYFGRLENGKIVEFRNFQAQRQEE